MIHPIGTNHRLHMRIAISLSLIYAIGVANASEFQYLSESCEVALALSAAPQHLQKDASVYVLQKGGYVLVSQGSNPFTCLVQRNHPTSLLPVCFDQEGAASIVRTILDTAGLVLSGATDTEINKAIVNGLESGKYSAPRGSSLSYMLSAFNRMYDEDSQALIELGPHSMIFTNHTRESILFDRDSYELHNVLPSISGMGPFNYFVVRAENATDSDRIETRCGNQIDFALMKQPSSAR